mmetsp:Transcript_3614/g.7467  ORF Transcript_3614/g.7467 Transcript_3614/m.7467 type:complete len:588 (-) Transcript_3614:158-1921(-)
MSGGEQAAAAHQGFDPEEMRQKLDKVLANKDNFYKSATASFKQFDKDQSGALDFLETKRLVARLFHNLRLPPVDDETLTRIFHRYDFGGDGMLLFEEFTDMYYHLLCRIRDRFYPTKLLRVRRHNFIRRTSLVAGKAAMNELFTFVKKLGSGSFGEVHLVEEKASKVKRVCKTICKDKSTVPVEQIEEEIRIMKELDHPNIIKIFEVFDDRHNMYIIMEYCQGGELLQKMAKAHEKKERLSELFVATLMKQLLSALSYIHKQRVIHKDLKPENIMFLEDSMETQCKLIDFGLAEMFEQDTGVSSNAAGTALYMAPEVYQRRFNFKCDVWSAGVIMYILLTGRLPYMGKTVDEVKAKVLSEKIPFDRDCKNIGENAKDLLKTMLVKDFRNRPTAAQCLQHPWFKEKLSEDPAPMTADMAENLKKYMKQGTLKNALTNMLTHSLTVNNKQLKRLQQVFMQADKDSSGTLSNQELSEALREIGIPQWDITRIVQALDVDDDKCISYTEFLSALYDWRDQELNQVWASFNKMDLDGDGKITATEFLRVLLGDDAKQKLVTDKADFEEMVRQIDLNGDGNIEWEEFVAFMKG